MVEKRKHKRTPFSLEMEIFKVTESKEEEGSNIRCKCRDISDGGLSFYSLKHFVKGDVLRVRVILSESRVYEEEKGNIDSIGLLAKVMYSRQSPEKQCQLTGVQFLNIYQQDYDTLCSYIVDTMSDNKRFAVTSSSLCLSKKSSIKQIK